MAEVNPKIATAPASRQEIRSVVVGVRLLEVLAEVHGALPLVELARRAAMPAAKAHRYLAGYVSAGLVLQDGVTGRYDLGPFALHLGLAALRRLDVVAMAEPTMEALRDALGETVSLTVWTNHGPTLVRWLDSDAPVSITVKLGTVLPLTYSSNGLVFMAHLPASMTVALAEAELSSEPSGRAGDLRPSSRAALEARLETVRASGISAVANAVLPGISSLSVPVWGAGAALLASLTVVGVDSVFDARLHGPVARALREAATLLSTRMGYVAATADFSGDRPRALSSAGERSRPRRKRTN